ncbi:C40 family peptidase [Pseudactinotalea sp. Z1732]|uniref:C40 family peptidase n=1 Tax=Micrococcales TaxID=85006 RepID=UPI003C7D1333
MTQRTTGARHRAACRPSTPLTAFGTTVAGTTGRRALAVVASSGLALTMGASTAAAAPQVSNSASGLGSLANVVLDGDRDSVSTSPTISVDADTDWSFTAAVVSSEAPPPPPPPPPPPAATTQRPTAATAPAARTGNRTAAPAQEETQQAEEQQAEEPASESTQSAAPASGSGSAVVNLARRYTGTPYVYGGSTPAGFDCSGFTAYVYAQFGVSLPRSSSAQRNAGRVVSASEARPGDLVWWPGHVGIYTGNGQHIAARNPSSPLHEGPIWNSSPTFIRVMG